MANIQSKDNHITSIEDSLSNIDKYEVDKLVRREELGQQLSFEEGREYFETVFKLADRTRQINLDKLSAGELNQLASVLEQIENNLENIENFNPTNQNPDRRDQLTNKLDDRVKELREILGPIIATTDIGTEAVQESLQQLESGVDRAEKLENQMESILESVQEASAETGVSTHAQIFGEEADNNRQKSMYWMAGAGLFAFLTGVIATWFILNNLVPDDATTAQLIQFIAGKIVILSIPYYGMIWCSRNYFAQRHNHVTNKHRQNALSTFETFANATNDADTKNTVLVEAADAIFSPRDSGYTKNPERDNSNNIGGIYRSMRGNSGFE